MTYDTLVFLRNVLTQLTIRVGEPDFRTTALSIIAALDELDDAIAKEVADAGNP